MTRTNLKEPTIEEIAEEIGISKEDIMYALDAIQSPMSLYEPIYTEGGDTLYVMDQGRIIPARSNPQAGSAGTGNHPFAVL